MLKSVHAGKDGNISTCLSSVELNLIQMQEHKHKSSHSRTHISTTRTCEILLLASCKQLEELKEHFSDYGRGTIVLSLQAKLQPRFEGDILV